MLGEDVRNNAKKDVKKYAKKRCKEKDAKKRCKEKMQRKDAKKRC